MTSLLIETVFLYVCVIDFSQTFEVFNVSHACGDKMFIKLFSVLQLKYSQ